MPGPLFQALVDQAHDERHRLLQAAVASAPDLKSQLVEILTALFDYQQKNRVNGGADQFLANQIHLRLIADETRQRFGQIASALAGPRSRDIQGGKRLGI